MYINTGYLNNSLVDFKEKNKPLVVVSCGTYRLNSHPKLPTYRPRGRVDYQLLYISSGCAHFHFENGESETIVTAGHMVLYRPKELQKYEYYGAEKAEVYWIHFTGSNVKNILRSYGIADNMRVFYVGASLEFERIFKRTISELQRCLPDYQELLMLLLRQLFIAVHRRVTDLQKPENESLDMTLDIAAQYFNDHYNKNICIKDYAASKGMSVSWFIRNFRQYTGATPMQYIVSIRITNAQTLLETTSYSISEIGHIVGYDNPLYFSRLFRKQKGVSPSEYRKNTARAKESSWS